MSALDLRDRPLNTYAFKREVHFGMTNVDKTHPAYGN